MAKILTIEDTPASRQLYADILGPAVRVIVVARDAEVVLDCQEPALQP